MIPTCLCHYYEANVGPFINLSDLAPENAEVILHRIRQDGLIFASKRASDYLKIRRELEDRVRSLFVARGGQPSRERPHYMVLGKCPWLLSWYQNGRELCIPLNEFNPRSISFTYGDTFPAMRFNDGKPYRGQVYLLEELHDLILSFGLPQKTNPDGKFGPDRYIEAQIWQEIPPTE